VSPGATIDELVVVGEPAPWLALGFSVSEGTLVAGCVRVRLRPPDADARGNANEAVLLTPAALLELAHFVARRTTGDDPISTIRRRQR